MSSIEKYIRADFNRKQNSSTRWKCFCSNRKKNKQN